VTVILMDPVELQHVALGLRSVAAEATEIGSALQSVCCCAMPVGISGYVDGELAAVGAAISEAMSGYGGAADELSMRASLIVDDQSMLPAFDAAFAAPTGIDGSTPGLGTPGLTDDWLSSMSINDGSLDTQADSFGGLTTGWLAGMDTATASDDAAAGLTGSWMSGVGSSAAGTAPGDLSSSWMSDMDAGNAGLWAPQLASLPHDWIAQFNASHALYPAVTTQLSPMGMASFTVGSYGQDAATTLAPAGLSATAGGGYVDGAGNLGTIADAYRYPGDFNFRLGP
jgi:hypothetical protein